MLFIFNKIWAIYKPLRKGLVAILVMSVVTIGLDFVWPYIYGRTIDAVIKGFSLHTILLFLFVAFAVMFVQNVISWIASFLQLDYIDYASPTLIQNSSLAHLLTLSIGQHRNEHSALTQSVISDGQNGTHNLLNLTVYQFLPYFLRIIIGLTALFIFSWKLGLVVFVGVATSTIVMYLTNIHIIPFIRKERDWDQEIDKKRMEILRNAPLVISNSAEEQVIKKTSEELDASNIYGKSYWKRYFHIAYVWRPTIQDLTLIASIGVAALLVSRGQLGAGLILTVILWTNTTLINLGSLGGLQRQILFSSERARKYFSLLDVQTDVLYPTNPIKPVSMKGQITFSDVSFVYSTTRIVEDDKKKAISKKVAPREALKRHLGVVEQHIVLFDDTIRRNISFGLPGGQLLSDAELDKLAKIARIDEFRDKLVDGWDTVIGENGIKLSGGQRQRVGIARALAKNPAIIILDEATSSLDAKNEALIKDALHDASEGRTTIMIAHRLSTVKDADRIFVFDKGEIVGVGKHEVLLQTCPTYADLVSHQTVIL